MAEYLNPLIAIEKEEELRRRRKEHDIQEAKEKIAFYEQCLNSARQRREVGQIMHAELMIANYRDALNEAENRSILIPPCERHYSYYYTRKESDYDF